MGRIHGKDGRFYMGIADGGTAQHVPGVAEWTINFKTDKADVTAQNDGNKQYVSGYPDATGTIAGFYDDTTAQLFTAALDGKKRKAYFYPDKSTLSKYFFGEIIVDASLTSGVSNGSSISGDWAASSAITSQGI